MLHMSETGAYTQEMLEPFSDRLANLKEILKRDSADGKHPEPIVRLMSRKLDGVGKYSSQLREMTLIARTTIQRSTNVALCALSRAGTATSKDCRFAKTAIGHVCRSEDKQDGIQDNPRRST
jgi:hypothetical protein